MQTTGDVAFTPMNSATLEQPLSVEPFDSKISSLYKRYVHVMKKNVNDNFLKLCFNRHEQERREMEERQQQEIEALKRLLHDDASQGATALQSRTHHLPTHQPTPYTGSHSVCLASQASAGAGSATQTAHTQHPHPHGLTHSASASQLRTLGNTAPAPSATTAPNATSHSNSQVPTTSPDHHRTPAPSLQSSNRPH